MANPLVPQGTLNRLVASVVWSDFPQLNVTASYVVKEGIGLAFEGPITTNIGTMTGNATSPEPYQLATIMIPLVRSIGLADLYKKQIETLALLGTATVRPDAPTLSPYVIVNCAIINVGELRFNGQEIGFGVQAQGAYQINNSLWG